LSVAEKRRCEEIRTIQNLLAEGYAPVQIKEMLHTTYFTIRRYATGDPLKLCRFGGNKPLELDKYRDEIICLLQENTPQRQALEKIWGMGYQGKRTAFGGYCRKLVAELEIPYAPRRMAGGKMTSQRAKPKKRYVSKALLLKHLWSGEELEQSDLDYILHKYPLVVQLNQCILDFRKIYTEKSPNALDEFIACYEKSASKPISSFASGLYDDLAAVKNSVIYNWNSGFAEGCNNKIKLIKRLMFGRAKIDLLRVKVLFAR
jgi:hypothetical protein